MSSAPSTSTPREHSICYQEPRGHWRALSTSPDDFRAALAHIESEGGAVAMVDSHWWGPSHPMYTIGAVATILP